MANTQLYQLFDCGNMVGEYSDFRSAKKALDNEVEEYCQIMGCGSIKLIKCSDVLYKFYGLISRKYHGAIYIKKITK